MKRFKEQELNKSDYEKTKIAAKVVKGYAKGFIGASLITIANYLYNKIVVMTISKFIGVILCAILGTELTIWCLADFYKVVESVRALRRKN